MASGFSRCPTLKTRRVTRLRRTHLTSRDGDSGHRCSVGRFRYRVQKITHLAIVKEDP
jgi:hypothetical protein